MVLANIEWIGTLCTTLSLAAATQLIIIGILAFSMPEVLLLTRSHISTAAGLIAGFVTLPNALRLKTAQISPNMDRIYGYTLCYQRLAMVVSGGLHFTSLILAVVALLTTTDLGNDFIKLMKNYNVKHSSKALVDNIQYILQCCGGHSYQDWFQIDWKGYRIGESLRVKDSIEELLKEDTDAYPDLVLSRYDSVPFSCCDRSALGSCIHQNLLMMTVLTINQTGCGVKLRISIHSILWFQFFIYSVCFSLEVAVLVLLKQPTISPKERTECIPFKRYFERSHGAWGTFENDASSGAILMPSSQSQVALRSM